MYKIYSDIIVIVIILHTYMHDIWNHRTTKLITPLFFYLTAAR